MNRPSTLNCLNAFKEFESAGYELDINQKNLKESFNICKETNGGWFKCFKLTHHAPDERSFLDLENMPNLKILTDYILEEDPDLGIKETIIYLTKEMIFKIKKGSIYPYKLDQVAISSEKKLKPKFHELCIEMSLMDNTRDETRTEETYVVSKDNKGFWFRSGNIKKTAGHKKHFNLDEMPNLKLLAIALNRQDPAFREHGGRVFITPTRIYRVKNNIESEIVINKKD